MSSYLYLELHYLLLIKLILIMFFIFMTVRLLFEEVLVLRGAHPQKKQFLLGVTVQMLVTRKKDQPPLRVSLLVVVVVILGAHLLVLRLM